MCSNNFLSKIIFRGILILIIGWQYVEGGQAQSTLMDKWTNHVKTDWVAGDGTYEISSAEELAGLAQLVNTGTNFVGKTIQLKADIDLKGKIWVPIGTYEDYSKPEMNKPFKGIFNGGGHVIKGMQTNAEMKNQALFGRIERATICNIAIKDAQVVGCNTIAGLVSMAVGSKIRNCSLSGTVFCPAYDVAGIVAWSDRTDISQCFNAGMISGSDHVGGIVGNSINSPIYNCYNTGSVTVTSGFGGGIVGTHTSISKIAYCYNTGSVKGRSISVGGIAAYLNCTTVHCCFNMGQVSGEIPVGGITGNSNKTVFEKCYYSIPDKGVGNGISKGIEKRNNEEIKVLMNELLDSKIWMKATEEQWPVLIH